jgi:hypothetical protein
MGSSRSGQDLIFGNELVRRGSGVELDQDLMPQGIELLALDGIDHGNEVLFLVQIVHQKSEGIAKTRVRQEPGCGHALREFAPSRT